MTTTFEFVLIPLNSGQLLCPQSQAFIRLTRLNPFEFRAVTLSESKWETATAQGVLIPLNSGRIFTYTLPPRG